jgi:AAA15 family ATPase/GTPase
MLVQFTVENFRSIKESVTFSMVSGSNNKINMFDVRNYQLLSSAVIYGANASGKSNILNAFNFMKSMVLNNSKIMQSTDRLPHEPFRLSTDTENASSTFEVVFFQHGIKYRYGFEADNTTVFSEWLFSDEKGKEARLFFRDSDKNPEMYINPDKFTEGKGLKVLPNSLFIWKCDQEGGEIAQAILVWFKNVNLLHGMKPSNYLNYTIRQMESDEFRKELVKLVKAADLGIRDLIVDKKEISKSDFEKTVPNIPPVESSSFKIGLHAIHEKFDEKGNASGLETFNLTGNDESEGTKKFFCLSAPFIDTLKNGRILIVDELDASLHPMLTMALLSLFNNPSINKMNAQLIFATHDTNLLNQNIFHKSQIWFTEKDLFGATHLSSLVEFKNVRPEADIKKHYIQGKFGAIPYLGTFSFQEEN